MPRCGRPRFQFVSRPRTLHPRDDQPFACARTRPQRSARLVPCSSPLAPPGGSCAQDTHPSRMLCRAGGACRGPGHRSILSLAEQHDSGLAAMRVPGHRARAHDDDDDVWAPCMTCTRPQSAPAATKRSGAAPPGGKGAMPSRTAAPSLAWGPPGGRACTGPLGPAHFGLAGVVLGSPFSNHLCCAHSWSECLEERPPLFPVRPSPPKKTRVHLFAAEAAGTCAWGLVRGRRETTGKALWAHPSCDACTISPHAWSLRRCPPNRVEPCCRVVGARLSKLRHGAAAARQSPPAPPPPPSVPRACAQGGAPGGLPLAARGAPAPRLSHPRDTCTWGRLCGAFGNLWQHVDRGALCPLVWLCPREPHLAAEVGASA